MLNTLLKIPKIRKLTLKYKSVLGMENNVQKKYVCTFINTVYSLVSTNTIKETNSMNIM